MWVAFIAITILAIVLRIQNVLTSSFAYTYDVGRDLLALQSIVETHKVPLIGPTTGLSGLFYGPTWYLLLLPSFLLSHGDPTGVLLFIGLLGVATVWMGWLIGKKLGGNVLAVSISFLMAISLPLRSVSQQIWSPNIIPFFVSVCVYAILVTLNEKRKMLTYFWFFVLGVSLGIIFDNEIVFGTLFATGFCLGLILIGREKYTLKSWISLIGGFFFLGLPRIIFELRHDFLMTRALLSAFTTPDPKRSFIEFSVTKAPRILGQFYDLWNTTLSARFSFVGVILLLAVIVYMLKQKHVPKEIHLIKIISLSVIGVCIVGMMFLKDFWGHFVIGVPVFYILLASIALVEIGKIKKYGGPVLLSIGVLLFLANITTTDVSLATHATWEGDAAVYRNQVAVMDYVYKQAAGEKFKYIAYTPTVYDYTYRYLFSWYGKKTYGYVPEPEKSDTLFVIMEPDFEHPERLTDWIDLRKNDGHIQTDQVVKGGIRVQKRTRDL